MDNRFNEPLVKTELMKLFTESPRAQGKFAVGTFIAYNQSTVNFEVYLGKQKEEPNTPDLRIVFRFSDIFEAYELGKVMIDMGRSDDWKPGERVIIESMVKDHLSGEMQKGPTLAVGISEKDNLAFIAVHEADKPTAVFKPSAKKRNTFIGRSGQQTDGVMETRAAIATIGELLCKKLSTLVKTTTIDVQQKAPVRSFSSGVADDDAFI